MLLSRRARELSLSVLLFAVPVVLLYGNVGRPSQLNPVDRLVLRASSGLQRIMVGGVGVVVNVWDHHIWLRGLDARNETLRHRNVELRENNEILKAWAAQGRAWERELGFTVTPPLRTYPADVVARGVSPFYQVLKIRRGTRTYGCDRARPWPCPAAWWAGCCASTAATPMCCS